MLADHLLPGDKWKNYFLVWPLEIQSGSKKGKKRILELKMNSWRFFKIHDNSEDSATDILSLILPINQLRSQIIEYRSTLSSQLSNFRQAYIIVVMMDPSNMEKPFTGFLTFMPVGINGGSVPGTQRSRNLSQSNIERILNSLNNTPQDHIPNDHDCDDENNSF